MSSAGMIFSELGRKCTGGHQHVALAGGRVAAAAAHPPQLRRAILRGADAQRRWGARPCQRRFWQNWHSWKRPQRLRS
eukprot:1243468-Alexandrium_andersonii.AAC.1